MLIICNAIGKQLEAKRLEEEWGRNFDLEMIRN